MMREKSGDDFGMPHIPKWDFEGRESDRGGLDPKASKNEFFLGWAVPRPKYFYDLIATETGENKNIFIKNDKNETNGTIFS